MRIRTVAIIALLVGIVVSRYAVQPPPAVAGDPPDTGPPSVETNFENASPLDWKIDADGAIQLYPTYDQEHASPNRANGHWHFRIKAKPGSKVTVVVNNLDN